MIKNPIAVVGSAHGAELHQLPRSLHRRGGVAAGSRRTLHLSNFEGGLLATVFLLGYFVTSPLFGVARRSAAAQVPHRRGRVDVERRDRDARASRPALTTLVIARAFVGIGEASYATLAPTIIDDVTPPNQKGRYLAIFFVAIPIGSAPGYLLGGFVAEAHGAGARRSSSPVDRASCSPCSAWRIDEPKRKLAAATRRDDARRDARAREDQAVPTRRPRLLRVHRGDRRVRVLGAEVPVVALRRSSSRRRSRRASR